MLGASACVTRARPRGGGLAFARYPHFARSAPRATAHWARAAQPPRPPTPTPLYTHACSHMLVWEPNVLLGLECVRERVAIHAGQSGQHVGLTMGFLGRVPTQSHPISHELQHLSEYRCTSQSLSLVLVNWLSSSWARSGRPQAHGATQRRRTFGIVQALWDVGVSQHRAAPRGSRILEAKLARWELQKA